MNLRRFSIDFYEKATKEFFENLFNKPQEKFTDEEYEEIKEYSLEINEETGEYLFTKEKRPLHLFPEEVDR
jgi:hypothetical protein